MPENAPNAPPNRGGIETEQRNPRSMTLHRLSAEACVRLMIDEDAAVHDALRRAAPALSALIAHAEAGFLAGGRLIYAGAGTSGRLGVLDASEAPPTFCVPPGRIVGLIAGGDAALRRSSEAMEDDLRGAEADLIALSVDARDTIIGIAAGGTTPYPRGALAIAKGLAPACVTALLTCARVDPPAGCDHAVVLDTGPEVLTGSTRLKAGTATKLALNIISTTLMIRAGRVYENLMVDLRASNDKLRDRGARIIATLTHVDRASALDLLEHASGEVKTAVVMARLGLDAPSARARLDAAGGRLDGVIE